MTSPIQLAKEWLNTKHLQDNSYADVVRVWVPLFAAYLEERYELVAKVSVMQRIIPVEDLTTPKPECACGGQSGFIHSKNGCSTSGGASSGLASPHGAGSRYATSPKECACKGKYGNTAEHSEKRCVWRREAIPPERCEHEYDMVTRCLKCLTVNPQSKP